MVGVFDQSYCASFAHVLAQLGATHAWVVHGADGLDEVSTTGKTHVAALQMERSPNLPSRLDDIGLRTASLDQLRGGDGDHNARYLRALLEGRDRSLS